MPRKLKGSQKKEIKEETIKKSPMKSRGWACIVYPESAPGDWLDVLTEGHVPTLVSPLHDRDVRGDGTPKKAHWHVLAMWDGPTTDSVASEYFARAGVTAPPEVVRSLRAYARYLVHLDDHDKVRYDEADVVALSGAIWGDVALDQGEADDRIMDDIIDWIAEHECTSYWSLVMYARHERPEWSRVVRTRTIFLSALQKSLQWEIEQGQRQEMEQRRQAGAAAALRATHEREEGYQRKCRELEKKISDMQQDTSK